MKRSLWFLFIIPLLIPLILWVTRYLQSNQIHNYDMGGFTSVDVGQRKALGKLGQLVREGNAIGKVRVAWDVYDPLRPRSSGRLALYTVELQRFRGQMTLSHSPFNNTNAQRSIITQYKNVSDEAVVSVARSGSLSEITRYGAKSEYDGWATYDGHGGWIFDSHR